MEVRAQVRPQVREQVYLTLHGVGAKKKRPNSLTGVEPTTQYPSRWFTPEITGEVTMGTGTTYSVYPSTTPISTAFTYAGEKIRLYVTSGAYSTIETPNVVTGTVLVGGVQDTDLDFNVTTAIDPALLNVLTDVDGNTITDVNGNPITYIP